VSRFLLATKESIVKTIDITPTREEATRIYAYVLCQVASVPMVLKDYWNPTEDEAERIRDAYSIYDRYLKLIEYADYKATDAERRKWAKASLKKRGF
jgi:hypothetical protein